MKRLIPWALALGAMASLAGWNAHAMVNYNEVLEVSDGTTISVSREDGQLITVVKLAPVNPDDAVWSRLSDTERLTLIDLLEGAVP